MPRLLHLPHPSGSTSRVPRCPARLGLILTLAGLLGRVCAFAAPAPTGNFNYAEALQKSLYFYEAQRSGRLPPSRRVEWRADSCPLDGHDVGRDLTGGLFEAGGYVKRNATMAFAAGMLAWSAVEYPEGYKKSGQMPQLLETLRWVNDYFLKCLAREDLASFEVYTEVGDPAQDRLFWASAEVIDQLVPVRPSYKVTPRTGGSDVLGNMAGAMAASSIVFRDQNQAPYADLLLDKAERLYRMAERYRGAGQKIDARGRILGQVRPNYFGGLYWACAWLHLAKNQQNPRFGNNYLTEADVIYSSILFDGHQLRHWEDFDSSDLGKGGFLLLARLTNEPRFVREIQRHLDWWTVGLTDKAGMTRGGLAYNSSTPGPLLNASLGHACNEAFLALVFGDWVRDPALKQRYLDFGRRQVRYALGDNPLRQSMVVGFGRNPPAIVRHQTAHAPFAAFDHFNPQIPAYRLEARHVLYGALIGGPDKNDRLYENAIESAQREPSLESNAGFTACLARLFLEAGGQDLPLDDFPPRENRAEEFFVEGGIASMGSLHLEVTARVQNQSAWPARSTKRLSLRYFITIPSNSIPAQLTIGSTYSEGARISPKLQLFRGDVYFVDIQFDGTPIFPGGYDGSRESRPHFRKEVRFRINHPPGWNDQLDWSYQGLAARGKAPVRTTHICLYDEQRLIFGQEPSSAAPPP